MSILTCRAEEKLRQNAHKAKDTGWTKRVAMRILDPADSPIKIGQYSSFLSQSAEYFSIAILTSWLRVLTPALSNSF
jgi:hypothetical protein